MKEAELTKKLAFYEHLFNDLDYHLSQVNYRIAQGGMSKTQWSYLKGISDILTEIRGKRYGK